MTEPFVLNLEQASEWLGGGIFTPDFLKAHKDEFDHVQLGNGRGRAGRIGFTRDQLREIVTHYTVSPAPAATPSGPITRRRSA